MDTETFEKRLYLWQVIANACVRGAHVRGKQWVIRVQGWCPITKRQVTAEGKGARLHEAFDNLRTDLEGHLTLPDVIETLSRIPT